MATPSYGERRQLTVVFSDIVGSTELSAQLDPEDWHGIISQYQQTATRVVEHFQGYIAQYMGDGVLVLFGYPKAHENDAERAVRAGLMLVDEIKVLNKSLEAEFGKRISVRVGIHTGEVMVDSGGGEGHVYGEAPNVSARVQTAAEANTVCISEATQHLVAGFFTVNDLGPHILKGVPEPIQLYRVERPSGVRSRLHAVTTASLTPFVGREEERNLLMNRWMQVQKGKGHLVMITGEAGIGKSRLLQQFKGDIGGIPHTWIEGESSPYEQDTPFAPIIELVENAFHWNPDQTLENKIEDLEKSFAVVGVDPVKSVPLMAGLLGLSVPLGKYPPILLSPEQQRLQLLRSLTDWVIGSAHQQPTVLIVEDLHFADPSTLEEFVMLGEQIENIPLLLLFTARPSFKPPWPTRSYHTLINLNRLDHEYIQSLISGLLGKLVQNDTLESLVRRADGNPLFAEELSQTLAGARSLESVAQQIPATLQDLLMARLDYLGPTKEIAQIGSVLGRSFSYSLLSAMSGQSEEVLRSGLSKLTESGLMFREENGGEANYTFKHALVQEAAYGSLLKSRRRELHRATAHALNEKFSDVVKQRPELVAYHLTEAGESEKAIDAWDNAAVKASSRAAYMEAIRHYKKALDVLHALPESSDRDQLELPLQIGIGHVLEAVNGFGSKEQEAAYQRAHEISKFLGGSPQFFFILLGLWSVTNSHSDINASQELADEMVRLAELNQTPMMLVWAYTTQALMAYERGNFLKVGDYYQKVMQYYKTEEHSWSPFDPVVSILVHTSLALWHRGFTDQACQKIREQLDMAIPISPANEAMARLGSCSLAIYLRDGDAMQDDAKRILEIAEEQQLASFMAWGVIYSGIAHIFRGENEAGVEQMAKGISSYLATGTHSSLGQYLGLMAEGYAQMGNNERALATIEDALGAAPDEKMHFPELLRLRTDYLWEKGDRTPEEIEQGYRDAIEISRQFASLTQELRAATRLGRLMQAQGRIEEAHELLAPLYAKFTEGFDTLDLRAAHALLDELSATQSL